MQGLSCIKHSVNTGFLLPRHGLRFPFHRLLCLFKAKSGGWERETVAPQEQKSPGHMVIQWTRNDWYYIFAALDTGKQAESPWASLTPVIVLPALTCRQHSLWVLKNPSSWTSLSLSII